MLCLLQALGSVSGFVTDASNGEKLSFANVYLEDEPLGSATNEKGYYYMHNVPAGTYTEGQICRSEEECGLGMTCLSNGGSDRLCFRFCRDDFDCFGTGSLCVYDLSYDEDTVVPGVRLCSKSCDPISNMGCPETFACMIYQEDGGFNRFLTDCDPHSGDGRDSDPCEGDVDCAPGFFCMPGEDTCVRYCVYPTGYCVVGTCNAFIPTVLLGSKEYGYCWD